MRDLHERYFHKLAVLLYDEPAGRPRQADEAGWEALLARLAALKKDDQMLNTASQLETVSVNRILPLREALEEVERQLVREAYERYGSSYKVAQALEISQSSANRKISKYLGGGPV